MLRQLNVLVPIDIILHLNVLVLKVIILYLFMILVLNVIPNVLLVQALNFVRVVLLVFSMMLKMNLVKIVVLYVIHVVKRIPVILVKQEDLTQLLHVLKK